jgi:hypothetical protein
MEESIPMHPAVQKYQQILRKEIGNRSAQLTPDFNSLSMGWGDFISPAIPKTRVRNPETTQKAFLLNF